MFIAALRQRLTRVEYKYFVNNEHPEWICLCILGFGWLFSSEKKKAALSSGEKRQSERSSCRKCLIISIHLGLFRKANDFTEKCIQPNRFLMGYYYRQSASSLRSGN